MTSTLRFGFVPQKAFQGQPAALSVVVRPTGVRCYAAIRYADASLHKLPSVVARAGKASWKWTIPAKIRIGSASANVACGKAGKASRSFAVVGPPSAPARVIIRKSGFSQRVRSTTREVSFGIVLSNPSPENDALDVSVLVNFIDSTNRVVATSTTKVSAVGAGSDYYLGGSTSIPDATPVSKLEIVQRIANDLLPSTTHRVGLPRDPARRREERVSFPMAVYLWEDEVLEVLPGLGAPRYPPIKAIEFHTRTTSELYGDDYAVRG